MLLVGYCADWDIWKHRPEIGFATADFSVVLDPESKNRKNTLQTDLFGITIERIYAKGYFYE